MQEDEKRKYNKIFTALNSNKINDDEIKNILDSHEINNIEDVNKALKNLFIMNNRVIYKDFEYLQELNMTAFHELKKSFTKEDTLNYISLIFSNLYIEPIQNFMYYYIIYKLHIKLSTNYINTFDEHTIFNLLIEVKEEYNKEEVFKTLMQNEQKSIFTFFYKKPMQIYQEKLFMNMISLMREHIDSKRYLIKSRFDYLFHNFLPYLDSFQFYDLTISRKKFTYIKLELFIYEHLKTYFRNYENDYLIVDDLINNKRSLCLNILHAYEVSDQNATKHIMNLFFKNYGRESLFNTIDTIRTQFIGHVFNKYNHTYEIRGLDMLFK